MPILHRRSTEPAASKHRFTQRAGFSLPELVVALVLVTVGLLALASTSVFLTYEHAASGRAERAAMLAGSRFEMLRAGGCSPAQGTETIDGLTTVWTVTPSKGTALATVRITWRERGAPVSHRYEGGFPC